MRKALVALTTVLFAAGTIGSNIGPALVDEHPVAVLTLSARNRNLLGSVPYIDALPFFTIGFLRLLAAALALFFVGRIYGDRALAWTESQVGEMPGIYRRVENFARRRGWLAVLLMPGSNIVCLLVGHMKMQTRQFIVVVVPAIVLRLTWIWIGGNLVEDQIRSALDWIDRWQWWIVGALFAVSLLQSARRRSPGAPEDPGPSDQSAP